MRRLILLVILSFSVWSCSRTKNDSAATVTDTLRYTIETDPRLVAVSSSDCFALVSRQGVFVNVQVRNDGNEQVLLYPSQLRLMVKEGRIAMPLEVTEDSISLHPDSALTIRAAFAPVHSRFLYHHVNLRGDIESTYTVILPGSRNGAMLEQTLSLRADEETFKKAVMAYGWDSKITPFIISSTADTIHNDGLKIVSNDRSSDDVVVRDNEILRRGFWVKAMTYHKTDTLHCRLRMVNQSSEAISVFPEALLLVTTNGKITPYLRPAVKLDLRKGDRAEVDLVFPVTLKDVVSLDLSGIRRFGDKRDSWFSNFFSLEQLQFRE